MNTPTRVAAFAAGLAAVFAVALGVGTLTGPVVAGAGRAPVPAGHDAGHGGAGSTDRTAEEALLPGGLMVSQDGYTLELARPDLPAGSEAVLRFRILGPEGAPVTRYTAAHGKDLHLVAVRRDLTDFQHVHPALDPDGTWSVPLDLSDPGVYRVFADFTPAAREAGLVLGADLSVAGEYAPQPLPAGTASAEVDGYTVTLDGTLTAGTESELRLSVSRDGSPVTDLQPYLEAYGHLVALRDGDLAYLHVHPAGAPGDGTTAAGPAVTFYATAPSAGDYRLFLDFRHGGTVHTAAFTVTAGGPGRPTAGSPPSAAPAHEAGKDHGHGG